MKMVKIYILTVVLFFVGVASAKNQNPVCDSETVQVFRELGHTQANRSKKFVNDLVRLQRDIRSDMQLRRDMLRDTEPAHTGFLFLDAFVRSGFSRDYSKKVQSLTNQAIQNMDEQKIDNFLSEVWSSSRLFDDLYSLRMKNWPYDKPREPSELVTQAEKQFKKITQLHYLDHHLVTLVNEHEQHGYPVPKARIKLRTLVLNKRIEIYRKLQQEYRKLKRLISSHHQCRRNETVLANLDPRIGAFRGTKPIKMEADPMSTP